VTTYTRCTVCGEYDKTKNGKLVKDYFICAECIKHKPKNDLRLSPKGELRFHAGGGTYWPLDTEIELGNVDYGEYLFVVLHHEFMHYILHKNINILASVMWDLVSGKGEIDKEIFVDTRAS